jgi:hypothetical protein
VLQLPELQVEQEFPPTGMIRPLSSLEKLANTDSTLSEISLHSGHGAGSLALLKGRSISNFTSQ